ncbi:Isoamyl acetate-hydrolyzing esterase 1-like [Hondaea fermentalgiana]|uniref:Isoamyl acetate-hydrolyzing esterase 1-like n=1 Tax=Hondaea fermentalgiana TaxID=2315210 RepID=A0A2R5GK39_9STRA|nr:Isoamyl acetate-hydrolyzing esterase 1-like [Hondaea fermentalgiana]|eukprot:GBG31276.1 Isoamyl acetate-hydrolyzing esterase 1-like [Hondaea fermentalgiana]
MPLQELLQIDVDAEGRVRRRRRSWSSASSPQHLKAPGHLLQHHPLGTENNSGTNNNNDDADFLPPPPPAVKDLGIASRSQTLDDYGEDAAPRDLAGNGNASNRARQGQGSTNDNIRLALLRSRGNVPSLTGRTHDEDDHDEEEEDDRDHSEILSNVDMRRDLDDDAYDSDTLRDIDDLLSPQGSALLDHHDVYEEEDDDDDDENDDGGVAGDEASHASNGHGNRQVPGPKDAVFTRRISHPGDVQTDEASQKALAQRKRRQQLQDQDDLLLDTGAAETPAESTSQVKEKSPSSPTTATTPKLQAWSMVDILRWTLVLTLWAIAIVNPHLIVDLSRAMTGATLSVSAPASSSRADMKPPVELAPVRTAQVELEEDVPKPSEVDEKPAAMSPLRAIPGPICKVFAQGSSQDLLDASQSLSAASTAVPASAASAASAMATSAHSLPGSSRHLQEVARVAGRSFVVRALKPLVVAAAAAAAAATVELSQVPATMRRFVLFGDSLTQEGFMPGYWVQRVSHQYVRRADVLNRGFSGYNTRWALELLPEIEKDVKDAALGTIFFGANDASDDVQHVPVDEYGDNLKSIVESFRKCGCEHIVLIAPPPLDEALYAKEFIEKRNKTKIDRKNELVAKYAAKCMSVADELGVACVPLFDLIKDRATKDSVELAHFFSDGLHLNARGGEILFDELMLVLQKTKPEFCVTPCKYTGNPANSGSSCPKLPPFGPWWDKIDPKAGLGTVLPSGGDQEEPAAKKAKVDASEGAN